MPIFHRLRVVLVVCAVWLSCLHAIWLHAQSFSDPNLQIETVLSGAGLDQPVGMAFLGNSPDDFFVIEKGTGRVKRFLGGASSTVLDLPVSNNSEQGLLGIAVHPDFGDGNDKVYLYYSRSAADGGPWLDNRLERFTWNGTNLVSDGVSLTFGTSSDSVPGQGPNHDGGPITFGPDGKLYGQTGDLNRNQMEQNFATGNSAFAGGIYRLNDDLTVPNDNPFVANANPDVHRWYAYGVRNGFGLAFDPVSGNLWDTENGPSEFDEVNLVSPGFNSGWQTIMGPDSNNLEENLVNLLPASTYSDPEFSWELIVAPTDLHFLAGSNLGSAYDDKLFVADNNNGFIYMLTLNAARNGFELDGPLADLVANNVSERNQLRVGQGFSAVTDFVRGPDGYIYAVAIGSDEIFRIVPEPAAGWIAIIAAGMYGLRCRHRRNQA